MAKLPSIKKLVKAVEALVATSKAAGTSEDITPKQIRQHLLKHFVDEDDGDGTADLEAYLKQSEVKQLLREAAEKALEANEAEDKQNGEGSSSPDISKKGSKSKRRKKESEDAADRSKNKIVRSSPAVNGSATKKSKKKRSAKDLEAKEDEAPASSKRRKSATLEESKDEAKPSKRGNIEAKASTSIVESENEAHEEESNGNPAAAVSKPPKDKKRKRSESMSGFKSAEFINSEGDPISPPKGAKKAPVPKATKSKGKVTSDDGGGSEELSELEDEPAKKKGKGKSTTGKKSKSAEADLSKDEQQIKKLKSLVVLCGSRPRWATELAPFSDSSSKQIKHLKKMLGDLGMKGGRLSVARAKEIGERRALEKEVASLGGLEDGDEDEEQGGGGRARRGGRKAVRKTFVESSDDDRGKEGKKDPFAFLKQQQASSDSEE